MKQRARISANQLQRMPIDEDLLRSVAAQAQEEEAGDQENSMWSEAPRVARRSDQTNIRGRRRASLAGSSGASAGNKLGGLGGRRRGSARLAHDNRVHTFMDPRIWIGRL